MMYNETLNRERRGSKVMNRFDDINKKADFYRRNKHLIPQAVINNYEEAFAIEYTHNSTAIEGNTLSLIETKLLLDDKLSVGGKDLREIYEVVNHNKAFKYAALCVSEGKTLDKNIVKDIHAILMENIMTGGIYRNVDVYISGAKHTPPSPNEAYRQLENFYGDLEIKKQTLHPVEFAAWMHAEFVKIHPFVDGNGRTSRLLMNFQLMSAVLLPVSIPKERKPQYFDALEAYACDDDLSKFSGLIAELEEAALDRYINAIEQIKAAERAETMLPEVENEDDLEQ
jgi:Fic family protein